MDSYIKRGDIVVIKNVENLERITIPEEYLKKCIGVKCRVWAKPGDPISVSKNILSKGYRLLPVDESYYDFDKNGRIGKAIALVRWKNKHLELV